MLGWRVGRELVLGHRVIGSSRVRLRRGRVAVGGVQRLSARRRPRTDVASR